MSSTDELGKNLEGCQTFGFTLLANPERVVNVMLNSQNSITDEVNLPGLVEHTKNLTEILNTTEGKIDLGLVEARRPLLLFCQDNIVYGGCTTAKKGLSSNGLSVDFNAHSVAEFYSESWTQSQLFLSLFQHTGGG